MHQKAAVVFVEPFDVRFSERLAIVIAVQDVIVFETVAVNRFCLPVYADGEWRVAPIETADGIGNRKAK